MPEISPVSTQEFSEFTALAERLQDAIEGLTAEDLLATPIEGEWCIHQILVHLADSEAVNYVRLRKTLAENEPFLSDFSEEAWGSSLHYQQQDYWLALRLLQELRSANAALFQLIDDEATWQRVGIHETRGRITVYDIFLALRNHGNAHLKQIEEVKQHLPEK